MGFFTPEEAESLQIRKMILHVVGVEDFVPATEREIQHQDFFIGRIIEVAVDAIYSFNNNSQTKVKIESIASNLISFQDGCQSLSQDFSRLHSTTTKEGALFIFELSTHDPSVRIYSLMKYDYHEAIEQTQDENGGLLRRIVHALIADKKAIQKSAIIRVISGVAELEISTKDRMKAAPEIVDYFARFLEVSRTLSDNELNTKAVGVLTDSLTTFRDELPNRNLARAIRRAKDILRDRTEIDERAINEAIFAAVDQPDNEILRSAIETHVGRKIRNAKLDGLAFRPDLSVLRRPPTRRLQTTEGVIITYPDDATDNLVKRVSNGNGGEIITIETNQIMEDRLVKNIRPS